MNLKHYLTILIVTFYLLLPNTGLTSESDVDAFIEAYNQNAIKYKAIINELSGDNTDLFIKKKEYHGSDIYYLTLSSNVILAVDADLRRVQAKFPMLYHYKDIEHIYICSLAALGYSDKSQILQSLTYVVRGLKYMQMWIMEDPKSKKKYKCIIIPDNPRITYQKIYICIKDLSKNTSSVSKENSSPPHNSLTLNGEIPKKGEGISKR